MIHACPSSRRRVQRLEKGPPMKSTITKNQLAGLGLAALGLAIAAAGIYIGETDDAPGAALIGILLMVVAIILALRTARRKAWRSRPSP
jgi:peptidoglycan/LPS O-acetylase OafA/YrhL